MAKYRKKPVVIEAEQFFVWKDREDWPKGVYMKTVKGNAESIHGAQVTFHIDTLEGPLNVSNEDWIITGVKGEKYPCKPDIFSATYEKVEN
jgi:hypothetical protein